MIQPELKTMKFDQKIYINAVMRREILLFLCIHTFSTLRLVALLIGRDYAQAHRLITKLEAEGLLTIFENKQGAMDAKRLVGISAKGVSYSMQNAIVEEKCPHFIPSKSGSLYNLVHKFTIQKYLIDHQNEFMQQGLIWPAFYSMPKDHHKQPIPDIILHMREDGRADFHTEVELTQKSEERYQQLLKSFLTHNLHVIYLFENAAMLKNVSAILARNLPKNWPRNKLILAGLLDPSLDINQRVWIKDNEIFETFYGVCQVYAMDIQLLKSNNDNCTYVFDFAEYPEYGANPDELYPQELIGEVDEKGRVIPSVNRFRPLI